ncbi:Zn-dependent hydrolase [Xaviernesmea oryzae]|uniref:Zn-dependent hydrolase n=1 Tax=Xaviernesmea oryzae TaxID=464029 RepID=A0A1Q9AZH6_9HYPH|nr:MBL fold metallo-hydrolase [Xaviernesmea oryzae]OLP61084.1 Zn-dependent hydrolase [Xaviernesmea oryzae]SEL13979.1 L-ascorbate metabolism protein UlaG, beta-lactamase superfamily [Xaviernesmea oryzae]
MLRYAVLLFVAIAFLHLVWPMPGAHAQGLRPEAPAAQPVSQCQAIAGRLPHVRYAAFGAGETVPTKAAGKAGAVTITYLGHSAFNIVSPEGVSIVTDYNGWYKPAGTPEIVTMNKAHSTHYTLSPDPAIAHVLHGWRDDGGPADHDLVLRDTYVRNVVTDIRMGWGSEAMEKNGNSIFIFEIAGLCIGHLGHLHQELTEVHYAEIGRLDVVMVPVDGGLTLGPDSMSRVVTRLRSALILPMHRRGPPIDRFLSLFGAGFQSRYADSDQVTVSLNSLPKRPLILVLQGV